MAADPGLDQLSRDELVVKARALGAKRPELLTRVELRDEIVRLGESDPTVRRRSRGWLGVARDLVASVVDSGLNMPGAAAAIRGEGKPEHDWQGPPPVATLTLAEIYLAQGHTERALAVLSEVLSNEPDHAAALTLRERIRSRKGPSNPRSAEPTTSEDPTERSIAAAAANAASEGPTDLSIAASVERAVEEPTDPSINSENPFPDEGSPLTGEVARLSVHASMPPEEPTVRGRADMFPDRPACALVVSERAVEALVEVPLGSTPTLLRVVWFAPGRGMPERRELDLPVEPGYHRVAIGGPPPGAEVRAMLAAVEGTGPTPIAVAWVYEPRTSGSVARFSPPGVEPATLRARVDARIVELR